MALFSKAEPQLTYLRDELVVPTDVTVDASYGRSLKEAKLRAMGDTWKEEIAGSIIVSRRPCANGEGGEGDYAIDGQHRLALAERLDVEGVYARVFRFASVEDEARAYTEANTQRSTPTSVERWKSSLRYHDPLTVALNDAVLLRGGRVAFGGADGVRAVATLWDLARKRGVSHVEETLDLLLAAFGRLDSDTASNGWLRGMDRFRSLHSERETRDMVARMGKRGYGAMAVAANMFRATGTRGGNAMYSAMVQEYNRNRKSRRIEQGTRSR